MGTGLSPGAHESVHDVLRDADRAELEAGHPHDGFLSLAYGFLPRGSSLLSLPPSHRAWDECAAEVPSLLLTHTASRTIAAATVGRKDAAPESDRARHAFGFHAMQALAIVDMQRWMSSGYRSSSAIRLDVSQRLPPMDCTSE